MLNIYWRIVLWIVVYAAVIGLGGLLIYLVKDWVESLFWGRMLS